MVSVFLTLKAHPPVTYFPSKATPPRPLQMARSRDQIFKWQRVWGSFITQNSQHEYMYVRLHVYRQTVKGQRQGFCLKDHHSSSQPAPYTQSIPARRTPQLRFWSPLHWPMIMATSFSALWPENGWHLLHHPSPAQRAEPTSKLPSFYFLL